jgi:hypothetical protein
MKDLEFQELKDLMGDTMKDLDKRISDTIAAKRAAKQANKQRIANMMREARHPSHLPPDVDLDNPKGIQEYRDESLPIEEAQRLHAQGVQLQMLMSLRAWRDIEPDENIGPKGIYRVKPSVEASSDELVKEAKHGGQVDNVLNKWRSGLLSDKDFLRNIYELIRNDFHDISKDPTGRANIKRAFDQLKQDKDWASAAQSVANALNLGAHADEAFFASNDEQIKEAKKEDKDSKDFDFYDCVEENKDKNDPEAYCASIKDKIEGTTKWRGESNKED